MHTTALHSMLQESAAVMHDVLEAHYQALACHAHTQGCSGAHSVLGFDSRRGNPEPGDGVVHLRVARDGVRQAAGGVPRAQGSPAQQDPGCPGPALHSSTKGITAVCNPFLVMRSCGSLERTPNPDIQTADKPITRWLPSSAPSAAGCLITYRW